MNTSLLLVTILSWIICILIAAVVICIDVIIVIVTKKNIWIDWCVHSVYNLHSYPTWCELEEREKEEITKMHSFRIHTLPVLIRLSCVAITFLVCYCGLPAIFNCLTHLAS
ncbi:hypothetical protein IKG20_01260 [Candidatus Saccharibacteria bacterium]|nr:hypothetical protein [Candidatus Saccharibacteria bacterium]